MDWLKQIKQQITNKTYLQVKKLPKNIGDQIKQTSIKPLINSFKNTAKILKVSAFLAGTGVFLFGLGHALNPIEKIINKNKDR